MRAGPAAALACNQRGHVMHELHQALRDQHHAKVLAQLCALRDHVGNLHGAWSKGRQRWW